MPVAPPPAAQLLQLLVPKALAQFLVPDALAQAEGPWVQLQALAQPLVPVALVQVSGLCALAQVCLPGAVLGRAWGRPAWQLQAAA